ncbi:MAG: HlyD family efflux transporter periplasmic adaptor subunit [Gemmatimonadaceae bacterium]
MRRSSFFPPLALTAVTAVTAVAAVAALGSLAACGRPADGPIEATGVLEVVEVDLASLTTGRVARVLVEEGDRVRIGDTLLVLELPTLAADLRQRAARVAAARAALQEAIAGPLPAEVARAAAEVAAFSADADRAASDVARLTPLARQDFASAQQLETAQATARTAAARRDAAAAQLELLRDGTRAERLAAARAELAAAEATLGMAQATARDLAIIAPVDGRVLVRNAEPGEVLAAGARAMVLAETGRQRVRIFVGQEALPRLQVGDAVTATLDAFPDRPVQGRIAALATQAEYTPRVALTERERADLLFAVRAEFRDTTEFLKAGLSVTVRTVPAALGAPGGSATP